MIATASIKPFRGVFYNQDRVDMMDLVLAPPYDVITPQQQKEYARRHEYNIINVDYRPPEEGDRRYPAAAELFDMWMQGDILSRDPIPAIYILEQYFIDWEGYRRLRRGFIALLKLEEFGQGSVYPHEKTFPKHKEDRLKLFRATNAQFNPVFSIFPDIQGQIEPILKKAVERNLPDLNFRFHDGVTNSLWKVTDEKSVRSIVEAMRDEPVFIADGHHRYETSLNLAREMKAGSGAGAGESPYDYTLMYFVSMEDGGLSVLSAHRMLKNLPDFDENAVLELLSDNFVFRKTNRSDAMEALSRSAQAHVMVLQVGTKFYIMRPCEDCLIKNEHLMNLHESLRDLEVSICRELAVRPLLGGDLENLLDHISYEVDPVKVANGLETGEYQAAIYLPPTPIRQMTRVARALEVMPHKSTYFFPKLLTGLVIHRFSDNNKD